MTLTISFHTFLEWTAEELDLLWSSRPGPAWQRLRSGAGGMGEVYRARDSKLKREVAIEALPAAVANDREGLRSRSETLGPDRVGRFVGCLIGGFTLPARLSRASGNASRDLPA